MAKTGGQVLEVKEDAPRKKFDDLPLFGATEGESVTKKTRKKPAKAAKTKSKSTKTGAAGKKKPDVVPKKRGERKAKPGAAGKPEKKAVAEDQPAAVQPASESRRAKRTYQTAQTNAQRQREISVSEFFAKNRHLLGFDSLPKALLTAVKEAVDNSLDACEEAGILPDVLIDIKELQENRFKLIVEDSGPGIVKSQVPKIFGKLLYGSKFHSLKQARGQQGIGISAAVMYAQLTTGKPVHIITRTSAKQPAHAYELQINTKTNTPLIVSDSVVEWEREHGIRIEMEILASYKRGQHSVDSYLHQVALANPHARLIYRSPKDGEIVYERLSGELPEEPLAIKPHPHGVELGVLMDMLKSTRSRNLKGFLSHEFSRMSSKSAMDVIRHAGLSPSNSPKRIQREGAERLITAFAETRIMKPPTNCLSSIGEDLLSKSVTRKDDASFFTAVTRPPAVYRGNPFQIEIALAYGVEGLNEDSTVRLCRFANRAPLIYQQSACAITQSVIGTAWKNYGVQQSRGALPSGSMMIVVHIASVWVPFTSESKEAIAHYPEIIKEIKLAIQECGRKLGLYIKKGIRLREEEKKSSYIERYIPHIGIALREILAFSEQEETKLVDKLKLTLEKSRKN
jgi:DNA topoisomerase-6 subunit B